MFRVLVWFLIGIFCMLIYWFGYKPNECQISEWARQLKVYFHFHGTEILTTAFISVGAAIFFLLIIALLKR